MWQVSCGIFFSYDNTEENYILESHQRIALEKISKDGIKEMEKVSGIWLANLKLTTSCLPYSESKFIQNSITFSLEPGLFGKVQSCDLNPSSRARSVVLANLKNDVLSLTIYLEQIFITCIVKINDFRNGRYTSFEGTALVSYDDQHPRIGYIQGVQQCLWYILG